VLAYCSPSSHLHFDEVVIRGVAKLANRQRMRGLLLAALVIVQSLALDPVPVSPAAINPALVEAVNRDPSSTWRAASNSRFAGLTVGQAKGHCGVLPDHAQVLRTAVTVKPMLGPDDISRVPASFDARTHWGEMCPSLKEVRDQASCGSSWAFAAVEAMSDRLCIATQGVTQVHLSAEDVNSCCSLCGMGCAGGYPAAAWSYWHRYGIVSGGNYNSSEGCLPYSIPACKHEESRAGSLPPCGPDVPTPACSKTCQNGVPWSGDKRYGATGYSIPERVGDIKHEIASHGPVEAAFIVYQDFLAYKSGVYVHKGGREIGGHAVKLIGWGEEEGTAYWIAANSWNADWGDNGFFKIRSGTNECGIESQVVAGLPKLSNTA